MNLGFTGKEYNRLKEKYLAYLASYKSLNNGSTEGATTFAQFYSLMTFVSKYNDPRVLASLGHK